MNNFSVVTGADGIAIVTFDVPGRTMNTLTAEVIAELSALVDRIKEDAEIKGVVLVSGKTNGFCAGADLIEMEANIRRWRAARGQAEVAAAITDIAELGGVMRRLETCGKPIGVAVCGVALGGGLELVLACHHRIIADDPRINLGLPEAKIGLLPGAGGTQRMLRIVGGEKAISLMAEGTSFDPARALAMGVAHAVVPADQAVEEARRRVLGGDAVAPWDTKGFRLPGGNPQLDAGANAFMAANALLRSKYFGNYPAVENILRAVHDGAYVPMDAGLRIENRAFLATVRSKQSTAMVRSLFHSMQHLAKIPSRPEAIPQTEIRKAVVLGAGMMGAGIAHVQALAGIPTLLIDVDQASAERGKAHIVSTLGKRVARGKMDAQKAEAIAALITPTSDYAAAAGADIVIEAVFEDRKLKAAVTKKIAPLLAADALFGSNTSTLPIDGLADAAARPDAFIGIHFFSPVDRMALVEIIRGPRTSDNALARALDYVKRLRKTAIVVSDSRGFYTSRTVTTYLSEGMAMLEEGIAPAVIENAGRMTSMPRGPLELADDVGLDLINSVALQTAKDLGHAYRAEPRDRVVAKLVQQGRNGRKSGNGFYNYPADGAPKRLWEGLAGKTAITDPIDIGALKDRLLLRQALEAARCMAEGVITDPRGADVGALLGWGFPAWTGGPISYIDMIGIAEFVKRCDALAAVHGERFAVPEAVRAMAAQGRHYYD